VAQEASSSRGRRGSKRAARARGGRTLAADDDAGGDAAALYKAMALQWMRSTLECVLAAGPAGLKVVLPEWRLLRFMEVRVANAHRVSDTVLGDVSSPPSCK
jgi:hypothetical protein